MYRFLFQPRWLGLTAMMLLFVPVCALLGQWQWDRYQTRHAANETLRRNLAAAPVPLDALTGPGRDVPPGLRGRRAVAAGRYDPTRELLVRNRTQEGRFGFYVLTPLVTVHGDAVMVNRGWVPAGATAHSAPLVPAPPTGGVTVTGRVRPAETPRSSGFRDHATVPLGQVYLINPPRIAPTLPYPVDTGYLELTGTRPPVRAEPAPVPDPEPANEWMNLAYFVQWNLFAAGAAVAWLVMVERQARAGRGSPAGPPSGSSEPTHRPGLVPADGHAGGSQTQVDDSVDTDDPGGLSGHDRTPLPG